MKTASGAVTCEKIILANNGHLESFGFAQRRLMHIFLYASMSPDLDKTALKKLGGQARWGITPSDPLGTTVRRIDSAQGGNASSFAVQQHFARKCVPVKWFLTARNVSIINGLMTASPSLRG